MTPQDTLVGSMTDHPVQAPHRSGWAHPPVASAPRTQVPRFRSRSASRFCPISDCPFHFMYLARGPSPPSYNTTLTNIPHTGLLNRPASHPRERLNRDSQRHGISGLSGLGTRAVRTANCGFSAFNGLAFINNVVMIAGIEIVQNPIPW